MNTEVIRQKASDLIKEASKVHHQNLEKEVVAILKNISNKKDYFLLLNIFYNYFHALEIKIELLISSDILDDYEKRRKSAGIAADIKALGFEVVSYDPIRIPEIETPLEALAAMYVMEGSTLGGQIIVKMLQQRGIDKGLSFFSGYGDMTSAMWQHFLEVLNDFPKSEAAVERMIQTVSDTFNYFRPLFSEKDIPNYN